ncbi:DnaJ domain-containing protein [Methylomonas sp. 2BW1-5-20]|uniref:DnaJ domain-containing protein n=1 Tax=Methylomonas sp. 2BW1-5-20 TaxID=3376686 RepID=UPI00404BC1BB
MTNIGLIASITLNVILVAYIVFGAKRKRRREQSRKQPAVKTASNVRTISCPSCGQHIKFTLPIDSNKARCRRCNAQFRLDVDDHRNVYITEIKLPEEDQSIKSLEDCYLILGVKEGTIPMDIKAAYKKKISEYHPDKVGILGIKIKQIAEDETRQINAAYAMLQENGLV